MAAIRNALDAIDWLDLAVEEGNVAQIEDTLHIAVQAVQRSRQYMESLITWLQGRFEDTAGSPPKKQRLAERPSGSHEEPIMVPQVGPALPAPPALPVHDPALRESDGAGQLLQDQGQRGRDLRGKLPFQGEIHPTPCSRGRRGSNTICYSPCSKPAQASSSLSGKRRVIVSEAHANLESWTTAIWGHPIQLVDSQEAGPAEPDTTQIEMSGEATPDSQADTVMVQQPVERRRPPTGDLLTERVRQPPHRRRRLHAVLADSSSDESE